MQATAPGAILDLAARGLGVGVLSESMADGVVITGVREAAVLALVWRAPKTAAVRAFRTIFTNL
jgi:DNA-binding transcriptional LysR family regulator